MPLASSLLCATLAVGCTTGADPGAEPGVSEPEPQGPETCQGEEVDLDHLDESPRRTLPSGITVALAAGDPDPVDRGDNTFTLELTDDTGAAYVHPGALDDGTFLLSPYMPAHGHGTVPLDFVPNADAEVDDGTYIFGPIDLFMPGRWDLHFRLLDVADGGTTGAEEDAVFTFCIEG